MPKFKFAKLVRDKIVQNQIDSGAKPVYRKLDTTEHKQALINKVIEEVTEITKASNAEITAEIADVQQAIDDLAELYGVSKEEIIKAQSAKNAKNGAFKEGLYVEYVRVDEHDKWIEYYRKNSDRYPEI